MKKLFISQNVKKKDEELIEQGHFEKSAKEDL